MINVGNVDRVVRFLVGVALIVAVFVPQFSGLFEGWGNWRYVVGAVGIVLLATSIFRICPLYSILGINTGAKA